jgi:hypothetical protein
MPSLPLTLAAASDAYLQHHCVPDVCAGDAAGPTQPPPGLGMSPPQVRRTNPEPPQVTNVPPLASLEHFDAAVALGKATDSETILPVSN